MNQILLQTNLSLKYNLKFRIKRRLISEDDKVYSIVRVKPSDADEDEDEELVTMTQFSRSSSASSVTPAQVSE